MTKKLKFLLGSVEKNVGKGGSAGYQQGLFFFRAPLTKMGNNSESQSISQLLQEMAEASLESNTSNSVQSPSSRYECGKAYISLLAFGY